MILCFTSSVYLPSSNSTIDEYKEYLDFLWALCDSLSDKRHVPLLGDFNGDLGDSLGDKGKYPPNRRGSKLQSVSWSLAEFRHNKIVQSPHKNYFKVCRQHQEK